jgi:pimeloyl-ACP methyl ester carboxylesterase
MVQVAITDLYKRGVAQVNGFEIPYYEAGDGPPVLVLHGVGGVVQFPGVDALTDRFRLIAPEIPGMHRHPYDHSASMRDVAILLAAFAEQIGLESYSVLAFAAAAKAGAWLASEASEQVEALILSSPIAILPEGHRLPLASTESLRHQADGGGAPKGMSGVMSVNESGFVRRVFGANRDAEFEAMLGTLKIPVLSLFGTEDFLVPPEIGRLYREFMPKSHYLLVPYSGPLIAIQRPSAFTSAVGDFLSWKSDFVYGHKSEILNP